MWYMDNVGNKTVIASDYDLDYAMHQFYDEGTLKIFAINGSAKSIHLLGDRLPKNWILHRVMRRIV
jgi:hypothetical protein